MGGDSKCEPQASRNTEGTAYTKDRRWSGAPDKKRHGGEYEPRDSRNVTGTASTPDGRWSNKDGEPPTGVPDSAPFTADEAKAGNPKR